MPNISIILPGYNVEKFLPSCIESILSSKYKDYELIFVDDGSVDMSKEISAHYDCRIISTDVNSGVSAARNLGAKAASGKYLLFIDVDTTVPEDAIGKTYKLLKDKARVVVCGRYSKEPLNDGFFQRFYALFKYYIHKDYLENAVTVRTWFFALEKEYFEEIGGFVEVKGDFEAEEFGRRISKICNIIHTPDIEIKHNWAGFAKLHKIYFNRVGLWVVRYLSLDKTFNEKYVTKSLGLANLCGGLSWLILFLNVIFFRSNVFILVQFVLIFILLYSYRGFLRFALSETGWVKTFLYFCVQLYFSLIVFSGACFGVFRFVFRNPFRNLKNNEFSTNR